MDAFLANGSCPPYQDGKSSTQLTLRTAFEVFDKNGMRVCQHTLAERGVRVRAYRAVPCVHMRGCCADEYDMHATDSSAWLLCAAFAAAIQYSLTSHHLRMANWTRQRRAFS